MREQELILYRELAGDSILRDMAELMAGAGGSETGGKRKDGRTALFYDCMYRLLEFSGAHGFYGNLWHCYLSNLLANSENSYSMACEVVGAVAGTINEAVQGI